jgi:hypothetical protein
MLEYKSDQEVFDKAVQWGADRELEACCEWLSSDSNYLSDQLRASRRPEPPSLKRQALTALHAVAVGADDAREFFQDIETIRTALEQLDD